MQNDRQILEQLNIRIGIEESKGDEDSHIWLASILAPRLAFRRADGKTFDDQVAFLAKVTPSDPRETEIESIEIDGDRAIVKCLITMAGKMFHNIRLFVRHGDDGDWKLLAWANEPSPVIQT